MRLPEITGYQFDLKSGFLQRELWGPSSVGEGARHSCPPLWTSAPQVAAALLCGPHVSSCVHTACSHVQPLHTYVKRHTHTRLQYTPPIDDSQWGPALQPLWLRPLHPRPLPRRYHPPPASPHVTWPSPPFSWRLHQTPHTVPVRTLL